MSDDKPTDSRTQVLLSLLPPGSVFRHCYSDDSLWRPNSRGYVSERDPLRAGLYQFDGYYAPWTPPDERPNDHSYTIDAAELLSGYTVQDGTPIALLIDEVMQLRARVGMHEAQARRLAVLALGRVERSAATTEHGIMVVAAEHEDLRARLAVSGVAIDGAMQQVGDVMPELCRLERECERLRAALIERGHTNECYSGDIELCDCPLKILGEAQQAAETSTAGEDDDG